MTRRTSRFAFRAALRAGAMTFSLVAAVGSSAGAQWSTTYEQFYLEAKHNWTFRDSYQAADRLFNAFDYGHAILYEKLWTRPGAPTSVLEEEQYNFLTKKVLVRPPRLPLEEAAIEVRYAQLAPEAKQMFDWAHILHRQIYDVLADERLSQDAKDREVQRLIAYYKSRPELAFSSKPKSMELMQEQPYSLAFREKYPKFNGLIWGYHWLQVGLYEPLMVGKTSSERQTGVRATVARFWQMLDDPPRTLPYQMPMTAAVAPMFTDRYTEAAIIFDNLHSMHDVISDILANPDVPRERKRAEIMRAARLYRDDTSYIMPVAAWRTMAQEMGIENMGGPAVGFLPALPTPTVTRGAVMEHDDQTGKMVGMKTGQMTGAMNHAGMAGMGAGRDSMATMPGMAGMDHSKMSMDSSMMASMTAMHMRMLADSGMRRHMLADTALRRLMREMLPMMPAEHRASLEQMLRDTMSTPARATRRPAPARRAATKPAAKAPAQTAPKADPHAGHAMPPATPAKPPAKPATRTPPPATDPHAGMKMPPKPAPSR